MNDFEVQKEQVHNSLEKLKDFDHVNLNEDVVREVIKEYNNKWIRMMESRASRECIEILEARLENTNSDCRKKIVIHAIYIYMNDQLNVNRQLFKIFVKRFFDIFDFQAND